MTVIHNEDFMGMQRVIYQSNYHTLNEIIMRGYIDESPFVETSFFVVAKFKIRPKDFSTTFLTKNESDNIHSNSSIFNPCNYRIMEYGELKSCINAAKTEEELLEARKAFRQFKEMGGDAREVAALYQRIKNKATKLVTPKALKR